jgi:serine/threonine protein kinase
VAAAEQQHAGLRAQARLLRRMNGKASLPRLLGAVEDQDRVTVVTAHPRGAPWAEVFGPGRAPADRFTAARVLSAAASLCGPLDVLHKCKASHRALHPGTIFVDGDRGFLRDAGLAEIPAATEEGDATYRAPEQFRAPYATGAWTDIYQLAAVTYHTLTGHPPSRAGSPPVRAALPGFPEQADRFLLGALDADPAARPAGTTALASALRAGRAELSRGAHR